MTSRTLPGVLFLLAALAPAHTASAQCSHWTGGFEAPGFDGPLTCSVVFDDGNGPALYVGGAFSHASGAPVTGIARWNGTSWSAVGNGINGVVTALVVFDDGTGPKLVAGGFASGPAATILVALQAGQWTQIGAPLPPDPTYGGAGVSALGVFDPGTGQELYAGGRFAGTVRRWNGSTWQIAGGGLYEGPFDDAPFVAAFAVHDDGSGPKLYVGGQFNRISSQVGPTISANVARLQNGTWTSVGNGLGNVWDAGVATLCSFDDGSGQKLFAGGGFSFGTQQQHMAHWNGSTWTPFGSGTDGNVSLLRGFDASSGVLPGLWISGSFDHAGGVDARSLARWDGAAFHAIGNGHLFTGATFVSAYDDGTGHGVRAFGACVNGIAEVLDGSTWTGLDSGPGSNNVVGSMAVLHGPGASRELWAAGNFTVIGGQAVRGLARFDGTQWHAESAIGSYLGFSGVFALDTGAGEELYATGLFADLGPQTVNVLRRTNGAWTALPTLPTYSGYPPSAMAVFDAGNGKHVYAGGQYGLWRLDANSWTSVIPQPNYPVQALAAWDDGTGPALYIGGEFATIGGVTYNGIARWNGQSLSGLAGGGGQYGRVSGLRVWDDGTGSALYASGSFTAMGGVPCNSIAKWDGQAWSPLGTGVSGAYWIGGRMLSHDDGSGSGSQLVLTGAFNTAGGQPAGGIARWNGSAWDTLNGGVSDNNHFGTGAVYVLSVAALDVGDGHGESLYVGGNFEYAAGIDASYIGRWQSCGGDSTTFCFGDGSITACPCGNASAVGDRAGCLNSLGLGGTLRTHGRASLSDDTLVLEGGSMPNSSVLYFQGASLVNGGAGVTFGDGVKCTAGPFVRLGTKLNVAGASTYPGPADPALSVRGMITSAGTRHYQARYRNAAPFCTPDTFNYTSGISVAWSN